jgi:hypothetical protein
MKTAFLLFCSILILNVSLSAQKNKTVIITAGTKMLDYFPINERYRYPEFLPGQVFMKNGQGSDLKLDYNFLSGEMEFILEKDTMYIAKVKDIKYVVVLDTFYYDNGYIEVISPGTLRVGLRQYVKIKDILKKGAYGSVNRGSSIDTYSSVFADGNSHDLIPNEDIEVQMMYEYFISYKAGSFLEFSKKNAIQLFPQKEDDIKAYLKTHKVDFESRNDLLRFTEYLRSL